MLNLEQINEIHRLAGGEHWSMRRIARQLRLAARTVKKYLATPVPSPVRRFHPQQARSFQAAPQRTARRLVGLFAAYLA
jgi:hypothetical protein